MKRAAECLECLVPPVVPVLPLKSTVLFPLQVASVQLASKPNVAVLEAHPSAEEIVAAGVWLDAEGSYARGNLCGVAVACKVLNRIAMPDGTVSVVLQGLRRVRIAKVVASRPYLRARAEPIEETGEETPEVRELIDQVTLLVAQLVDADERYPDELVKVLGLNLGSGSRCADFVADRAQFSYADKRDVLRTEGTAARLTLVARILRRLIARARVTDEVQAKTAALLDRTQRKSLLRAQLAVIRRELDELDPAEAEIAELENRIRKRGLPPIALEEVLRHVQRLREPPIRALEGAAIRDYVEWTLSLPWEEATKDRLDLRRARRVFDERFFAFAEPKKRLIEFLAVRKLGGSARKSLLAVVGPPGTGRTSLARTIAEILGRAFVHLSVRSLRGEAAVRGRRRTDVAGHPSLLLDALREAGARNPVVLIDDWDFLDEDADDAVSELVGALDPVRSHRFLDHYLGVPFDLSQVLFVLTACVEDSLPEVLSDRMSIIELPGYTEPEKVAIARRYIWPEVVREHGIRERGVSLTAAALRRIVRLYTREAGVYELRGQLERICRRIAVREATGTHRRISIHVRNLEDFLDAPVYVTDPVAREPQIGAVTGLAWTEDGGDLLPIEALLMPGEGRHILTGLLGEVMQESVEAAVSYVRSRSSELGIEPSAFTENDLHVHFPEGAIAKDGPSAGVAVATTIASLLSGRPVRPDLAMTGEIQLRGSILAVGGVREKVLAAYRAGIKHVILPKANERDLSQIPREVRGKVRLHLVEDVADVFKFALTGRRRRARGAGPSGSRPRSGGMKSAR